jgi:hypothetical protein
MQKDKAINEIGCFFFIAELLKPTGDKNNSQYNVTYRMFA